jgi:hypothetical protein
VATFEISRAAPKRTRIRGAWIKPEAHSYIDVKACAIAFVSAAVEGFKQKSIKKNRQMSIAPSSQLDFPSATM